MVDKYIKDGQVGVLVSGGYGAGWSTWSYEYGLDLALDKRIIEKFLELSDKSKDIEYEDAEKEMDSFLKSIGYNDVYVGGLDGLHLEMVDEGIPIRINEYDGFESLEVGYTGYTTL